MFLPCNHGGLGVKQLSFVYYSTRIAFLVKILNHDVEKFSFIARESLELDMKKRNVTFVAFQRRNFLDYELDENGALNCKSVFACQSDWIDLGCYTTKIGVNLELKDSKVVVLKNDTVVKLALTLQKALYNYCMKDLPNKANDPIKEVILRYKTSIGNVQVHYYSIGISIMTYFPTKFTLYLGELWDRQKNPRCSFGCFHKESMAHVLNGCIQHFSNFYSRRHNLLVEIIASFSKKISSSISYSY